MTADLDAVLPNPYAMFSVAWETSRGSAAALAGRGSAVPDGIRAPSPHPLPTSGRVERAMSSGNPWRDAGITAAAPREALHVSPRPPHGE